MNNTNFSRRHFLALAATAALSPRLLSAATAWSLPIGVCGSSANWDPIQKAGCSYVEENVAKLLSPKLSDADYAKVAADFKAKKVPVHACNGFLPADLKLVGPDANHDAVLQYATTAIQRAKLLNIPIIVLGSGGSRKVPDGFDRAKAETQFVDFLKRLAPLAQSNGITIAMESLNQRETNFGVTLRECLKYIKAANSPHIRLTADMYHMLREDEGPDALLEAGSQVVHCHIAEKAERTPPGTAGDDFKPYLRALKQLNFQGRMSLECKWKKMTDQLPSAVSALKSQLAAL